MKTTETYLAQMDRLAPWQCWLLARHKTHRLLPITQDQLSARLTWGIKKIRRFCGLRTWAKINVQEADNFRAACGITRWNEAAQLKYLRRTLDLKRTTNSFAAFRKRPASAQKRISRLLRSSAWEK